MAVDPVILASARKHRISDEDMLHAYRHPNRVVDLDDLVMLTGPIPPHDSWKSVSLSPTARRHRACHARPRQVPGDLPRSIQDILDHGDQLAELFENYEPEPGDERPVEEYVLHRAALARSS